MFQRAQALAAALLDVPSGCVAVYVKFSECDDKPWTACIVRGDNGGIHWTETSWKFSGAIRADVIRALVVDLECSAEARQRTISEALR